ncbi:TlpA disulfide reductase family protein [Cocleimonas sp. KMM 6892]|uniref:TlpA family protein disulfide reductase n=1 Tax=unclassified Cocleimonas TaxID=2639732 RepID=UPI002DB845B7|nr:MULTISPECIES: TlpA disulfide reductase family protein [unclassified Cocleimonas]MEB8433020.1 TlpA disulfide reductase family protein [Cocleimonas sp. KMM 6892]MEC4715999.1 TlpA disulfide reductase family protein [Cocleimonas sp. KMM 6895]MEC4745460.1 TlpA disulfide reductase family protein [Cocleimonas sp. KMM 6896]
MNKLYLLGIIGLVAFLFFGQSSDMPTANLQVHNEDPYNEMDGSVGGRCLGGKCLTVYVAPWCPACKSLRPTIIDMVETLEKEGIEVKVIIGKDSQQATEQYAKSYPFPVLLDPQGDFFQKANQRGVPFFMVSDSKGKVVSQMAGGTTHIPTMREQLKI